MERIDAHQHLWHFTPVDFEWLHEPAYTALRRDFLPAELRSAMREARVDGGVAVQVRQTLDETAWLLREARTPLPGEDRPFLRGVVGWAPIAAATFPQVLEELRADPLLKGLRHIVQAEPAGFLAAAAFGRGMHTLTESGLVYDLLLAEQQLPEAIAFVDRHPRQSFVLDHLAKPKIAAGELEPWATQIRELARRANVTCKVSGMVTEARWSTWTLDALRPYLDTVVAAFGFDRVMAGSDWPVCLVASGYTRWWRTLETYFGACSGAEQDAIFGGVATRVYRL